MTEAEWQASDDVGTMLRHVENKVSARKLRLFVCACCRLVWDELTDPRSRNAVEVAERYADGGVTERELAAASLLVQDVGNIDWAAYPCVTTGDGYAIRRAFRSCWDYRERAAQLPPPAIQADLLRCIVGNPFRPVRLPVVSVGAPSVAAPASSTATPSVSTWHACPWLDHNGGTVRRLAEDIYADRAFDHLPILADALEEAGCQDVEMLAHLRGPGPHARGCWVVDLLLGKS